MSRAYWLLLVVAVLIAIAATGALAQPLYQDTQAPQTAAAVPGGLGGSPPSFGNNPVTGYPPYSPTVTPFPPNDEIAREASLGPTAVAGIPAPVGGTTAISITDNAIYVISGGMLSEYDRDLNLVQQVLLPATEAAPAPPAATRGPAWIALLTGLNAQDYTYGKGVAYVWLDTGDNALHYLVSLTNVKRVTGVYIHYRLGNLPLEQAPPVAPLYVGPIVYGPFTGTLAQGTLTADNLINLMAEHPVGNLLLAMMNGRAYVTVHTTQRPQGELMGKLVPLVAGR